MATRTQPIWGALAKAAGAVALVVLTAWATYIVTGRSNVESARQQQQSAAIAQFEQSGAQMDANLSLLVDALLDRKSVSDARSAARASIILHSSQAYALDPLTGTGNVQQYVVGLGDLRSLTDHASDAESAHRMAQKHVNLMDYRRKLLALAKSRLYQ